MKKSIMLTVTILLISIISLSYVVSAAPNKAVNNPFNKILESIGQLREGINNIWNSIYGLQEQIDNIESTTGPQGKPGINGQDGMNGSQGEQGLQGASGIDGVNGSQGPQGGQGLQGVPGISEVRIAVFDTNSIADDLVPGEDWWQMDVSCENNEFATGGSIVALDPRTGLPPHGDRGGYFYPLNERTWHAEGSMGWSSTGNHASLFELRLVCVKYNNGTSQ